MAAAANSRHRRPRNRLSKLWGLRQDRCRPRRRSSAAGSSGGGVEDLDDDEGIEDFAGLIEAYAQHGARPG